MSAGVRIQLNSDAVGSLFPVGSEARVELQTAVVAEFVRKNLRETILGSSVHEQLERTRTDMREAINIARQEVANAAVHGTGVTKKNYGGWEIKGDAAEEIKRAIRVAFDTLVHNEVSTAVQKKVESMQSEINRVADQVLAKAIEKEIATAVKAKVEMVMRGLTN